MDGCQRLNLDELSDTQMQSAIRFAEERIRWIEEDHAVLVRSYRDELVAMRRHLVNRIFARMAARGTPLSGAQRQDLRRTFRVRSMTAEAVCALVRAATKGRTDRLDALTEIEAMAIMLHLQQHL